MEPRVDISAESKRKAKSRSNAIWLVIGAGLVTLIAWSYARFYQAYPYHQLSAYRVSSGSMCPAICEKERIIGAMDGYWRSEPRRGDIIMMKHATSEGLFIKRVIGVGGDFVSTSEGQILVNGKPLAIPLPEKGCGNPVVSTAAKEEPVPFDPVKVPASSFFVVGDNLPNSYDSRIQGFGFVTLDQVRGRPLFIYWSPNSSRIGCPVR